MKIAILGTRGIPGRYGGFETFADQLSHRLVAHGHQATVYCREPFTSPHDVFDPRIRRVILPTITEKHLDTPFHTFISAVHVLFSDAEIVLFCNAANGPLAWIPRLAGKPTVLNVDGLDRTRRKWNVFARAALSVCEAFAAVAPTRIVTDAELMRQYYWNRYHARSTMIAYGAEVPPGCEKLENFDVAPGRYILYVSRFEPENNPELVIEAYRRVQTDWPLVMVGGSTYEPEYAKRLRSLADPRVVFPGFIYGPRYWQLLNNAGLYLFACEVGGVHPALIEAMAARRPVLYLDTPENRETAADCAVPFPADPQSLAEHMDRLLADRTERHRLGDMARARAEAKFGWEETTRQYEALFAEVLAKKNPRPFST